MARTKGAKNRIGATAKDNIINVFSKLGGTKGMADWAVKNRTDFYRLYAKLVPQQVDLEITARPIDASANPLPQLEWDEQYSSNAIRMGSPVGATESAN